MAVSNYRLAFSIQDQYPHTYNALQKLVMAMADYVKYKDKKTWFGRDKGLKYYKKFESQLRDTLLAMVMDGIIARNADPGECREKLLGAIGQFSRAYPNWQDAYGFAEKYFVQDSDAAEDRIQEMMQQA